MRRLSSSELLDEDTLLQLNNPYTEYFLTCNSVVEQNHFATLKGICLIAKKFFIQKILASSRLIFASANYTFRESCLLL